MKQLGELVILFLLKPREDEVLPLTTDSSLTHSGFFPTLRQFPFSSVCVGARPFPGTLPFTKILSSEKQCHICAYSPHTSLCNKIPHAGNLMKTESYLLQFCRLRKPSPEHRQSLFLLGAAWPGGCHLLAEFSQQKEK